VSLADLRVFITQFARRHGQLIVGALKALSAGLLMGALGFSALQIVPIYFKSYEFEDAARKEAHLAAANLRTGDAIRDDVYQKAQDLGLPVEIGDIKVQAEAHDSGVNSLDTLMDPSATPNKVGSVDIDVAYAVPIEFPGWTFHLNFQFHADDRHM
jgi:hypothetical protein